MPMQKKETVEEYLEILGFKIRDRVTGMTGVATSVSFDLYGCVQIILNPGVDKDGKTKDLQWLDFNRVEKIPMKKRVMDPPIFILQKAKENTNQSIDGPENKPIPR